jgi:hypothetical protein
MLPGFFFVALNKFELTAPHRVSPEEITFNQHTVDVQKRGGLLRKSEPLS